MLTHNIYKSFKNVTAPNKYIILIYRTNKCAITTRPLDEGFVIPSNTPINQSLYWKLNLNTVIVDIYMD